MDVSSRYIDLMKKTLANVIYGDGSMLPSDRRTTFDLAHRTNGMDWPTVAHTMAGLERLENVRVCVEDVLARNVPGDFIETGVWRGGMCIFMRAILAAHDVVDRSVWVADSFCGLPEPDAVRYPADAGDLHHTCPELAVTLDQVRANFAAYDLLDDRVRFLPGWFRDTLAEAPIEHLAILRLDGDMYESTALALEALYPKLSPGGFAIVDDYGAIPSCRAAVDDYRRLHDIADTIVPIDWTGIFWQKR